MKKAVFAAVLMFTVMAFSGCSNADETGVDADSAESPAQTSSENSLMETSEESSSDKIGISSSAVSKPLALNVWGSAAKYSTKEQGYINVPVRITSVTRGAEAAKTVKSFMDKSSSYNYIEPDSNAEWVVADYEISLDGFPVDEGGTDSSITAFITGTDGDYMDYGDKKWSTTTINIIDGQYYYEGIVKGKVAYQMLKGRSDYVITLGEYNETQSFFKENEKV